MCNHYILDTKGDDKTQSRQSARQVLQEIIQVRKNIENLRAKEVQLFEELSKKESKINKFVKK